MNNDCNGARARSEDEAAMPRRGMVGFLAGALLGGSLALQVSETEARKKGRKKKKKKKRDGQTDPTNPTDPTDPTGPTGSCHSWLLGEYHDPVFPTGPIWFNGWLRVEVNGVPIYDGGADGPTRTEDALTFEAPIGASLRYFVRRTNDGCPGATLSPVDLVCATTGASRNLSPLRDEGLEGTWDCDNAPLSIAFDYQYTVE